MNIRRILISEQEKKDRLTTEQRDELKKYIIAIMH